MLERLRSIDWAFAKADTGYLGHDLHPYPAKFIPQIPANLIVSLSLRGEVVWDPFGGSGTTALEALLLGRRAISTDANPVATLITRVKCTALSPEERDELRLFGTQLKALADAHDVEKLLAGFWPSSKRHVPAIPNLATWFCNQALLELAYIVDELGRLTSSAARDVARVALSAVVVSASNQDSETRYARRQKRLAPGSVLRHFCLTLDSITDNHEPLERLLGYRRATIETLDTRSLVDTQGSFLPRESVDLVVTSPPYPNSNDYHLYHRFRLFWLGYDPRTLGQQEIGSHLRHQRERRGFGLYLDEMRACLKGMASRLRPGRYAVMVLGDSVFHGKTFRTSDELARIAEDVGLQVVGSIPRQIHPTRRSFIPAARRNRSEDLLVLRHPPRRLKLLFCRPPYRMWPYEADLRRREVVSLMKIQPQSASGDLAATVDSYTVDRAQRLAFTHRLETVDGGPTWKIWQSVLENGDAPATRKDPKYLTHGIHSYKGKFYPQLAKALINIAGLTPGAHVLDPFCGSGTVLLEAQLNGFRGTGFELNPLAVLVSRAKTAVAMESPVVLDRVLKDFTDTIAKDTSSDTDLSLFSPALRDEIDRWFPRPVARRLAWLIPLARRVPNGTAQLLLQVLLSSIVRLVSQQEPADLRIRRRKERLHDAPVVELFVERIAAFRHRLRQFAERMAASPVRFLESYVEEADSRSPEVFEPYRKHPFDCVITSPPYATALPYIDTDRLSILLLFGMDSRTRARLEASLTGSREIRDDERRRLEDLLGSRLDERLGSTTAVSLIRKIHRLNTQGGVGFRRRNMSALLVRYYSDMWLAFQNLATVVRPRSHLFFVIGDNHTVAGSRTVTIRSGEVFAEMGQSVGWRLIDRIPITVTRENLLHIKHSITRNEILVFRSGH